MHFLSVVWNSPKTEEKRTDEAALIENGYNHKKKIKKQPNNNIKNNTVISGDNIFTKENSAIIEYDVRWRNFSMWRKNRIDIFPRALSQKAGNVFVYFYSPRHINVRARTPNAEPPETKSFHLFV